MSNPPPPTELLTDLRDEADRDIRQRTTRAFFWKSAYYSFGVIPSVASVVTGAAVLTNVGWSVEAAGVAVLILGIVSLAITFYNFQGRMVNNFIARAAWQKLRDDTAAAISDVALDEAGQIVAYRRLTARREQIRNDEANGRVSKS